MAGKTASVNINIVADAAKAVRGFKDAGAAGEAMEKALKKAADKMEAELEQTAKIAQALAQRLGPGFRTTVGETPEDIARRFARTGLTLEELDSNIDGITDQLRRLEGQADDTASGMTRIGDSADRSRSVMANFTGNAIQELPGVAGSMGPLNVAMGQFAEYAAEGGISLKGLTKIAGPMAGLATATWAFSKASEQAAKRTEELSEAIDEFSKVADDEVLRLYARSLTNVVLNGGDVNDFLEDLARNNEVGAKRLLDTMKAAGMTEQAMGPLRDAIREVDREQQQQYETEKKYGEELQKIPGFIEDILPDFKDMTGAVQDQVKWVDWLDSTWSTFWGKLDKQALTRDLYSALFLDETDLERQVELVGRYVQNVLGLPPDVMNRLIPMIEQGQVDAVWSLVSALQHIRDMVSSGSTRMGEAARAGLGFVPGYANGTMSARPGLALVGEEGPELVQFGGGERVYPTGTGPMGGTVNVTVNMPAGSDGDDVVRALQRWTRSNGALPLPVTSTAVR